MAPLEIRPAEREDAPEILRSFNEVFAEGAGEGRPPRTLAGWRWAYERNPAGRRAFVAVDAGRVVAHFAALPARTLVAGRELSFAQGVDSFALPSHRGAAGGQAFVRTARAFFEAFGGAHDALYYGWPAERAWRVGNRALGYEAVQTQTALLRAVEDRGEASDEVETLRALDHQALWLFERCADGLGAATVRDAAWLTWRFLEHPEARHELLGARDEAGILRGLAAYRRGVAPFDELGLIADWLVPDGEDAVAGRLLSALEARAARDGARALAAWLPERSPWFARFQERGFRVAVTPWRLAVKSFTRRLDEAWLRATWWHTLADSDLV